MKILMAVSRLFGKFTKILKYGKFVVSTSHFRQIVKIIPLENYHE